MTEGLPAGRVVAIWAPGRETPVASRVAVVPGELSVRLVVADLTLEELPAGTRLRVGAETIVELPATEAGDAMTRWAGLADETGRPPVPVRVLAGGDVAAGDPVRVDAVPVTLDDALDLHAFRPADVADVVREYVGTARASGLREVRIVHGRGRGVQRAIVREVLGGLPGIAGFADAPPEHGGWGATLVRLVPGADQPGG